jgi:hypothetical protein
VSIEVGAQYGIHPRQMPSAARLEPINNMAVETQMHGSLAVRHDDAGLFPKVLPERFRLGRIGPRLIFAVRALGLDRFFGSGGLAEVGYGEIKPPLDLPIHLFGKTKRARRGAIPHKRAAIFMPPPFTSTA